MNGMRRRAWSLLTISGDRQYGGNTGYGDDPERVYRYDSEVANSRQVSEGDLVVLRDREGVLGAAVVDSVKSASGLKDRLRCPVCRTTGIKKRKNAVPVWRCNKGHAFDHPIEEKIAVINFEARYERTFRPPAKHIASEVLKGVALRPSDQMSIEEIDPAKLIAKVDGKFPGLTELIQLSGQLETLAPRDADGDIAPEEPKLARYKLGTLDERRKALRSIAVRRGQRKFRDALLKRYGEQCLISGCTVLDIVEAAHIAPYRRDHDNHPENGLLLRSDLHTLFDLDLLGIEPESLTVVLAPELTTAGYGSIQGTKLAISGKLRPSADALKMRWRAFRQRHPHAAVT